MGMPGEGRLFDYALNLGARMEADLDLLWLAHPEDAVEALGTCTTKAARQGIRLNFRFPEGSSPWDKVRRYLNLNAPPPMAAIGLRELAKKNMKEIRMLNRSGFPITLVSFKS
ncbi:MAG: hypothetical protein HQL81_00560 [Magnetococcales bacterium]|nr:hypothetical protein [Magnetococcales bacterium]